LPALRNARSPRTFVASGYGGRAPASLLPLSAETPPVFKARESVRRSVLLKTPPISRRVLDKTTGLPKIMTVHEIADFLRVHPSTIYRLIKDGTLPGMFRVGADWRIRQDALEEWISGRQNH